MPPKPEKLRPLVNINADVLPKVRFQMEYISRNAGPSRPIWDRRCPYETTAGCDLRMSAKQAMSMLPPDKTQAILRLVANISL